MTATELQRKLIELFAEAAKMSEVQPINEPLTMEETVRRFRITQALKLIGDAAELVK